MEADVICIWETAKETLERKKKRGRGLVAEKRDAGSDPLQDLSAQAWRY